MPVPTESCSLSEIILGNQYRGWLNDSLSDCTSYSRDTSARTDKRKVRLIPPSEPLSDGRIIDMTRRML
jgi:hypothetical protein